MTLHVKQYKAWDVGSHALNVGLALVASDTFDTRDYPGYKPRNAQGSSRWFKGGEVYCFRQRLDPPAAVQIFTRRTKFFLCVEHELEQALARHGYTSRTRRNIAISTTPDLAIEAYRKYNSAPYLVLRVEVCSAVEIFRNHRGSWRIVGNHVGSEHLYYP